MSLLFNTCFTRQTYHTTPVSYTHLDVYKRQVESMPPYHCQYNPIELIWAQVKRYVANKNTTFRLADIELLAHEALDGTT